MTSKVGRSPKKVGNIFKIFLDLRARTCYSGIGELTYDEYMDIRTLILPSKCYYFGSEFVTYDQCKAECDSLGAQMPW